MAKCILNLKKMIAYAKTGEVLGRVRYDFFF